jgi:hypothetical protein
VLVSAACPGCARARALVHEVRSRHPGLDVRVVDLDEQREYRPPAGVVGTPSWLLDGRPLWAGNPSLSDVGRALKVQEAASGSQPGEVGEPAPSGGDGDAAALAPPAHPTEERR